MPLQVDLFFCDDGAQYVVAQVDVPNVIRYTVELDGASKELREEVSPNVFQTIATFNDGIQDPAIVDPMSPRSLYFRADTNWTSGTRYQFHYSPTMNFYPRYQRVSPETPDTVPTVALISSAKDYGIKRTEDVSALLLPVAAGDIKDLLFCDDGGLKVFVRIDLPDSKYTVAAGDFSLFIEDVNDPTGPYVLVDGVTFEDSHTDPPTPGPSDPRSVYLVAEYDWIPEVGYEARGKIVRNLDSPLPETAPNDPEADPTP